MLIDIIVGARPNFVKIAPIIRAIKSRQNSNQFLKYRLIHTGQHYDKSMSNDFFIQLNIPDPDINLGIGSGTQAEQTAGIMVGYEKILLKQKSDLCLVVGDVTSTMAAAIVAQKLCIPVAHVESGIRSGDWSMPEEINRIITDSITNYFFTTSEMANNNLVLSGISRDNIFFVGNTMIDTLLANLAYLRKPSFFDDLNLTHKNYFVLTLHRPSNVDERKYISRLLNTISSGARDLPIIFPAHPRTMRILKDLDMIPKNIFLVDPQSYLEFNYLVGHSRAVITDSGGVSEETTVMSIPCMTLRNSTERPETVVIGTNELVGTNPDSLASAFDKIFSGNWKKGGIPPMWDGKASERIVAKIESLLFERI